MSICVKESFGLRIGGNGNRFGKDIFKGRQQKDQEIFDLINYGENWAFKGAAKGSCKKEVRTIKDQNLKPFLF